MARDQPQPAFILVKIAALIVQHEPGMDELLELANISRAQANRYLATLRTLGCRVESARRGTARFFRIEHAGIFNIEALRHWQGPAEAEEEERPEEWDKQKIVEQEKSA